MRIISQDGTTDFQYENFAIAITKDNKIVACKDLTAKPYEILASVIASYSTQEKAQKAMDMLREKRNTLYYIESVENTNEIKYLSTIVDKENFYGIINPYFKFPKDEDVEV